MQHGGQSNPNESSLKARRRSIARARLSFNPTLNRPGGRVSRQARRCLIAENGVATMTQLKAWCYAGREHRHWQIRQESGRLVAKAVANRNETDGNLNQINEVSQMKNRLSYAVAGNLGG
jgi:hypothetical protein